jgi:hypothetical protein
MNVVLAVKATVDTGKIPSVDPATVSKGKEALAPILGNPMLWAGLIVFGLLALYLSSRTSRTVKLVALGILALLAVGWDSQRGVLTAAAGSKAAADQWLMTGLGIGGAWALLRGPSGRTAGPGGPQSAGRRGLFARVRRGR